MYILIFEGVILNVRQVTIKSNLLYKTKTHWRQEQKETHY